MKGENKKMRKAACAAMALVTAVTIFMVRDFMKQAQGYGPSVIQGDTQPETSQGGNGPEAGGVRELTEADYAAAQQFAIRYSGEWNVEQYFNGEQWKVYEQGKRLVIAAYNYLNDSSYTTGGYNKIVGYEGGDSLEGSTCPSCGIGNMRRMTGLDALLDSNSTNKYRCDFCGYEKRGESSKPIYEYVPEEYHEFHGKDIEYSTPAIIISDKTVDMSEMGGPVFDLVMFRVDTIDGKEYLINDDFKFALHYDGNFLEYCEPDTYGYYQGYYAFI